MTWEQQHDCWLWASWTLWLAVSACSEELTAHQEVLHRDILLYKRLHSMPAG